MSVKIFLFLLQNYPGYPLWSLVTKSYILSENITQDCLEGGRVDNNGCDISCNRLNTAYTKVCTCWYSKFTKVWVKSKIYFMLQTNDSYTIILKQNSCNLLFQILDCERGCTRNLKQSSNRCDRDCVSLLTFFSILWWAVFICVFVYYM